MLESVIITTLVVVASFLFLVIVVLGVLTVTFLIALIYVLTKGISLSELQWKDWRGE